MQIVDLEITKVGTSGHGVGTDLEGNIYFVPRGLPGDLARLSVENTKKRYREGELIELLKPSTQRQESLCEHFQQCGGCDWLNWNYQSQLEGKENTLKHTLKRNNVEYNKFQPILSMENPYGYRNRIQVRAKNGKVGFYERGSHNLVDITACQVAHPKLNEAIDKIRQKTPTKKESQSSVERKIELTVNEKGDVTELWDSPHSAGGFVQINETQNRRLCEVVKDFIAKSESKKVLELYCGNGNLTYPILDSVDKVVGFDGNALAVEDAKKRRENHPTFRDKVAFFCSWINEDLKKRLPDDFKGNYDTLLLDPPRRGVEGGLTPYLHTNLKNIIYVSCSPTTFSIDSQCLLKDFYLEEIQPIDMFPHTHHIELVGLFRRKKTTG